MTLTRAIFSSTIVLIAFLTPLGCGKSDSSNGNAAKTPEAAKSDTAAAAPAIRSDNPLIGTWTNKDPNAMFSLPDREYTDTEMISHDQHWPATYKVEGNTITVTATGLPQMTCTMIDDNTMRLTMAQGPGGTMIRYVPLKLPDADPTEQILTALHARDYEALHNYDKAETIEALQKRLAANELFNLLGHDVSWKVIGTEPASTGRNSISQTKLVQIDFKSATDAPLVESGYLKQATVKMGLTYARRNASETQGAFSFGGARDPAQDVVWDTVPFHGIGAAVIASGTTQNRVIQGLRLIGIGGKAPYTATVLAGDDVVATATADGSPPDQRGTPSGWQNNRSKIVWQLSVTFNTPFDASKSTAALRFQVTDADGKLEAFSLPANDIDYFFAPALYQNAAWKTSFISGTLGISDNTPESRIAQMAVFNPDDIRKATEAAGQRRAEQRASLTASGGDGVIVYQFLAYPKFWSVPVIAPPDMKHVRVAWADGAQVEMMVDNQALDPAKAACAPSSLLRFRAAGDRPVPVAVRFHTREYVNDAEKGSFVMPAWPPAKSASSADSALIAGALVKMLTDNREFTGTLTQDKPYPLHLSLTWNASQQCVTGSAEFPELKASKAVEGFIIDDHINSPYLQLIETGPISVDPRSGAFVGIAYRLTTDTQLPGNALIRRATYGDPASGRVVDVTDEICSRVREHSLKLQVRIRDLHVADPAYGAVKTLSVECVAADGQARTVTAKDGETLSIDHVGGPPGVLSGAWSYRVNTLQAVGQVYAAGLVSLKPATGK
jgi:hypothetical protein